MRFLRLVSPKSQVCTPYTSKCPETRFNIPHKCSTAVCNQLWNWCVPCDARDSLTLGPSLATYNQMRATFGVAHQSTILCLSNFQPKQDTLFYSLVDGLVSYESPSSSVVRDPTGEPHKVLGSTPNGESGNQSMNQ